MTESTITPTTNKTQQHSSFYFQNVKDVSGLKKWLMKSYFDPGKHASASYYSNKVSEENVLEFVSNSKNKFPQTPHAIIELWHILPGLQKSIRTITLNFGEDKNSSTISERKNTRAEHTLSQIGSTLGNLTTTMVDKISEQARERFARLLKKMSDEAKESSELLRLIEDCRLEAAEQIVDCLYESSNYGDFSRRLLAKKLLHKPDLNHIDKLEQDSIEYLISLTKDDSDNDTSLSASDAKKETISRAELEDVFLMDIQKDTNLFRVMQLAVSRKVFDSI